MNMRNIRKRDIVKQEIYVLLKKEGPLTLKEIAEKTGLTPYRVEYYIKQLLAEELVTKTTWTVYKVRK